jgi:hypothetical protein
MDIEAGANVGEAVSGLAILFTQLNPRWRSNPLDPNGLGRAFNPSPSIDGRLESHRVC